MKKTRVMFRGIYMETLINCAVRTFGAGQSSLSNSVYCLRCLQWLHKKCCGIRSRPVEGVTGGVTGRGNRCCGFAKPIEEHSCDSITVGYTHWSW